LVSEPPPTTAAHGAQPLLQITTLVDPSGYVVAVRTGHLKATAAMKMVKRLRPPREDTTDDVDREEGPSKRARIKQWHRNL
jgi:hypothetical protein